MAVAAVFLLLAAGCAPDWMDAYTLTEDQGDSYVISGDRTWLEVTAPGGNRGSNLRVAMLPRAGTATATGSACATWTSETTGGNQEGIVLAWTGTTGVTVTKNVWAGVYWVVNVHTWDTTRPDRFTGIAQFVLPDLIGPGPTAVLPWRMCAAAAPGAVTFRVWPLTRPEPAPGDPCCTGTAPIPGLPAGRAGWYVGHLSAGDRVIYSGLAAT